MNALACLLLLTAVMMARSDQVADFLKEHPHNDHIYFFDVTSEASVGDLKGALKNFTIDHSFRVISEFRHLFVIQSNDTAALRHLNFPSGSEVTQYPVERVSEYYEMFNVGPWLKANFSDDHSSDDVLMFSDWILDLPKTVCPKTFEVEMKTAMEQFKEAFVTVKPMLFPVLATYPPRMMMFHLMDENAMQNAARKGLANFGGYGHSKLETKRVVRN